MAVKERNGLVIKNPEWISDQEWINDQEWISDQEWKGDQERKGDQEWKDDQDRIDRPAKLKINNRVNYMKSKKEKELLGMYVNIVKRKSNL